VAVVEASQNFQKERYAMKNSTDIIALRRPDTVDDPLTEIARDGARRMLAAALRAEADNSSRSAPKRPCRMAASGLSDTDTLRAAVQRLPRKWRDSPAAGGVKLCHFGSFW